MHASPAADAVDVYVTAPGTDITDVNVLPNFTFDYRDPAVDAGALPAGTYDITVTLAGTDLAGWSVVGYNGNGGVVYDTENLSGTIPAQQGGFGTLGFSIVLPFLVTLVDRFGGNALVYGVVGAAYPALQMIGAPILGRWSDRYGRRRILREIELALRRVAAVAVDAAHR